ncbi:replication initiator [Streptantibioticus ferralitis]|uniref:Plasmid replication initiator protein n=1 Tax=Streptantibioticus ferralitis TaxID=236510 RepID=A0ABT5YVE0_9ACTN|nr:replication initiator [Streptantibioticus ferralitis]MDF2255362.1 plasmid replication initiator protein [Streptantibioticus ferralitis]
MVRVANEPGFSRWLEQIRNIGGCAHPIYLSGQTTWRDPVSGSIIRRYSTEAEPGGRLALRCNNRRKSRCGPCSYLHAGDTYHVVRSGLVGGKGTPVAVRDHPRLFVTLTAPSFGAVHSTGGRCHPRRDGGVCEHGRPVGCGLRHADTDPAVGQPLCRDCYDLVGHVLWHAMAGTLWTRWTHAVRRHLATRAGINQSAFPQYARLSFAKVAEYQKRGAVHFHAVIRLDGPDGPDASPPGWGSVELLQDAVRSAAETVVVRTPYSAAVGERVIRWGTQIDVHPIHAFGDGEAVSDDAVAAYIAKYTSKSIGDAGGTDQRVISLGEIWLLAVNPHVRALMATCWRLGGLPEFEGLRLRAWAHTLGFRGHVLTKSRVYSTTYAALRVARAAYRQKAAGDQTAYGVGVAVVESAWRYVGSGHSLGQAWFARAIAEQQAHAREDGREALADCRGRWSLGEAA